ncbi:MAG: (2Fe-2S)-binding protein [Polyangiales bacterium]
MLRESYQRLRELNPSWVVELGTPAGAGWIEGGAFAEPERGPFAELLTQIGERLQTRDRKVIAASFALRFGWSSAAALGPHLLAGLVPDLALANTWLRFSANGALFERVCLIEPRLSTLSAHATLVAQSLPVVDALSRWSRFPRKALWGQVESSWAAQFEPVLTALGRAGEVLQTIQAFFADDANAPHAYEVTHCDVTRVYHRRASCCLYYKVPSGHYCVSCPLITDDERIERNKAWTERTL